uniref:Uncharacterized protein n=1 Tax=Arundo donax TaxID=35708 RepID=A0A0A9A297_ARUDO
MWSKLSQRWIRHFKITRLIELIGFS